MNANLATVTEAGVTTTYAWNVRNQLTGISNTGFAASFSYDSFGRRTGKTVQGTTTNFVYDGLTPVQEKSGATVTANLITGLGIDEFFQRTDGVGSRALLTDALGSTVALGDGTGTLQTQYTYEPFGYAAQTGQANSSSYKYTGREDDGSGLYYYRARYYHPRLQRFIAEDPIGFEGGDVNLYGYVFNRPTVLNDPRGLSPFDIDCFFSNFGFAFDSTNDFFFGGFTRLSRTGIGAITSGAVARSTGLTTIGMAWRPILAGQGVANLSVAGTVASVAANAIVNGVVVTASLEVGIVMGSTINAAVQTLILGTCPSSCDK